MHIFMLYRYAALELVAGATVIPEAVKTTPRVTSQMARVSQFSGLDMMPKLRIFGMISPRSGPWSFRSRAAKRPS